MAMGTVKAEESNRTDPTRAAVNLFSERLQRGEPYRNRSRVPVTEDVASTPEELYLAKRGIGILSASKRFAENEVAHAKSQLLDAKRTAEELMLKIKQSKENTNAWKQKLEMLGVPIRDDEAKMTIYSEVGDQQSSDVLRELEAAKQELVKLKLDVASASQAKARADHEAAAARARSKFYKKSAEELEKMIEDANEEHVLVEIARIEATKEAREIEAQKEAEAARYSHKLEETKAKILELRKEISYAKKLEKKLAITTADLDVLQNEMVFVRAMEKNMKEKSQMEENEKKKMEIEAALSLKAAQAELEASKKELASIREEGFKFMTSMDVIRQEKQRVAVEASQLKKLEGKTDTIVQNLNSKILKAKAKLESVSAAEKKAQAMVANLSTALQNLRSDIEKARKEKELYTQATESIKLDIWATDASIDVTSDKLHDAKLELEAVKASEAAAVAKLRTLIEMTMWSRASPAELNPTVAISKFEFEYLINCAQGAQEIADKKVEAAKAWVQAFNNSEKEIMRQIETTQRKITELKMLEQNEHKRLEKILEAGIREKVRRRSSLDLQTADPEFEPARKSFRENGTISSTRKSKTHRRSLTSVTQASSRGPSISLRRKTVMPGLVKFLRGRRAGKRKSGVQ